MARSPRVSLTQLFVIITFGLALVVAALFFAFLEVSRAEIVQRSDALRDASARQIGDRVTQELAVGANTVDEIERALRLNTVTLDDPLEVEELLLAKLLDHPGLSDLTFIHATSLGFAADGAMRVAPEGRWQVSVYRAAADPESEVITRRTFLEDGRFVAARRARPRGEGLLRAPFEREADASDPAARAWFVAATARGSYGTAAWVDLHYSPFDAALPQQQRRVGVSLQRTVEDAPGHFAGAVRAGLLAQTIDTLASRGIADGEPGDPRHVVLCDAKGRLVARLAPEDPLEPVDDTVRAVPRRMPPEVAGALATPELGSVTATAPRSTHLEIGGQRFLVAFRALASSPGWVVGVIAPEDFYTRDLLALRNRFLLAYLAITSVVLVVGWYVLRQVHGALGRILGATSRMRRFDFRATPVDTPFRDIAEVIDELERAKTAMRALTKYVPIDLVRDLHDANRDPVLGGRLVEVSVLFTDIADFTGLAERLAPDALAQALGLYLEAMSAAILATKGIVDKFIGDAVMALWNVPTAQADHARRACSAVLACMRATGELFESPAWEGQAPLVTRYGLHQATVLVGHFGAPERLNYTALGDGVNVAARLESLCKQYRVTVLVSETIVAHARDAFAFRLVDKVAVKGKVEALRVYELLGTLDEAGPRRALAAKYEGALEAYFRRDFAGALAVAETLGDDGPGQVLAERCRRMIEHPPPAEWNGVFVAATK